MLLRKAELGNLIWDSQGKHLTKQHSSEKFPEGSTPHVLFVQGYILMDK